MPGVAAAAGAELAVVAAPAQLRVVVAAILAHPLNGHLGLVPPLPSPAGVSYKTNKKKCPPFRSQYFEKAL